MFRKDDPLRAFNQNREQISKRGAIFNLNEGIDFPMDDNCVLRLIGWPGTGTRMVSFHLLIHHPGGSFYPHSYILGEECIICLKGAGEVDLGRGWERVESGNVIFIPRGLSHATRCAVGSEEDFLALSYVCPSPLELYHKLGLMKNGLLNIDATNMAMLNRVSEDVDFSFSIYPNDLGGIYKAEDIGYDRVKLEGGIFHLRRGAPFRKFGGLIKFVVWPGVGSGSCGLHTGEIEAGKPFKPHMHPISEDAFMCFNRDDEIGEIIAFLDDRWFTMTPGDIIYAPPGIYHGSGFRDGERGKLLGMGCACPPQLDLYELADYIKDNSFTDFEIE